MGALISILRQRKNHCAHINPGLAPQAIVAQPRWGYSPGLFTVRCAFRLPYFSLRQI